MSDLEKIIEIENEIKSLINDFERSLRPKRKVHRLLKQKPEYKNLLDDILIDDIIIVDVYKFFEDTPAKHRKPDKEKAVNKHYTNPKLSDLIHRVIYVNPKTIVLWNDGTKTVVCAKGEKFDKEKGLLMAYYRRFYGESYMKDLTQIIDNAENHKTNKKEKGEKKK